MRAFSDEERYLPTGTKRRFCSSRAVREHCFQPAHNDMVQMGQSEKIFKFIAREGRARPRLVPRTPEAEAAHCHSPVGSKSRERAISELSRGNFAMRRFIECWSFINWGGWDRLGAQPWAAADLARKAARVSHFARRGTGAPVAAAPRGVSSMETGTGLPAAFAAVNVKSAIHLRVSLCPAT